GNKAALTGPLFSVGGLIMSSEAVEYADAETNIRTSRAAFRPCGHAPRPPVGCERERPGTECIGSQSAGRGSSMVGKHLRSARRAPQAPSAGSRASGRAGRPQAGRDALAERGDAEADGRRD